MTAHLLVAACDGVDPIDAGCASSAITADSAYITKNNHAYALVELRYSTECRTAWARTTLLSSLACVPGDDHCATATIVRNSDGLSFSCHTPAGVGTSCYTEQVNDAGVTSYAIGTYDNGPYTYKSQTGSYADPPEVELDEASTE